METRVPAHPLLLDHSSQPQQGAVTVMPQKEHVLVPKAKTGQQVPSGPARKGKPHRFWQETPSVAATLLGSSSGNWDRPVSDWGVQ